MRLRLDENLGRRIQELLRTQGHGAATVRDERLAGSPDRRIYEACRLEQRILLTLDLDFADVTRFSPADAGGIVVLRMPRPVTGLLMERMVRQFLKAAESTSPEHRLWIVEPAPVRIHESADN